MNISFPFWPVRPEFAMQYLVGMLALVGIVFTVIMLIDCLKRKPEQFAHPLSTNAAYDKIIWALAMVFSLSFYFVGTIVYFFVVFLGKKEESQGQ